MSRELIKRLCPSPAALQRHWFLRRFSRHLSDPRLWGLCRHGVTGAFGAGLAICFIPLPVHFIVATLVAITFRLSIPVIFGTILLNNPLTMVPIYYGAYRVGIFLLNSPPHHFHFRLSWDWLEHGLGPMAKPFLLGCLICGVVCGVLGYMALELTWRWRITARYRTRHAASAL